MAEVYEGSEPYIFVSYAHADRTRVLPMIDALADAGYRVWFDKGIEWVSEWPDYIADRVYACALFLVFVSEAAALSRNCKNEINYACKHEKEMLVVYLEDVDLDRVSHGLELQLGSRQAQYLSAFDSDEAFVAELLRQSVLEPCLREEARQRRETKRKAMLAASNALSSSDRDEVTLRDARLKLLALPDDDQDNDVWRLIKQIEERLCGFDRERARLGREEAEREKCEREKCEREKQARKEQIRKAGRVGLKYLLTGMVACCMLVMVLSSLAANNQATSTTDGNAPVSDEDPILAGYSWEELKNIADKIAAAKSDDEGLDVARFYGLVDASGRLHGGTKPVTLTDGTETSVRIAGFRHDDRSDNSGKAGITFEFADAPESHRMNSSATSAGGWEASGMREWLNSNFLGLLPEDLRSNIAEVRKSTNNKGFILEDDPSVVTSTDDRVWLLSICEVYGELSGQDKVDLVYPAVYDAEGTQYKLYDDQGVTIENCAFCTKSGTTSWWWLRSPYADMQLYFHYVGNSGSWAAQEPLRESVVSPGFCF